MTKFYEGRIRIGRSYGGDETMPVSIEVTDASSYVQFIEVKMDLAEFASALFGRGDCACTFSLRAVEKVGMVRQHETREIFVPDGAPGYSKDSARRAWAQEVLAPHEADGWRGDFDDLTNGHRFVKRAEGGNIQRVIFRRHVPAETTP